MGTTMEVGRQLRDPERRAETGPKVLARDIHVAFAARGEPVQALDGVDLEVREGEFLSLIGPSGCGKSTFLRMVAGLERADSGDLYFDSHPITGPSPDRGMAFQSYALFPWMTLLQNVEFGPKMRGVGKKERLERARRYLRTVGLSAFEERYPDELSGGMQQRGSLARLFANEPKLLLMDEPLGALDAQTRELIQEELIRIWQDVGTTVLFVTHSIDEAVFLSDRVAVMTRRPGRIKTIVDVDLPRPRTFETRGTEEFARLEHQVGALVREEVEPFA